MDENEGLDLQDDESEKLYGEIIDYQGITEEFNELVDYDKNEIEKFTTEDKKKFKQEFKKQIKNTSSYFDESYHNNLDEDDLREWSNQLTNIKNQDQFISDFQNLRTLYRNISPDKFLVEYEGEYQWYHKIYDRVRTSNKSDEEDVMNALVETVKNNVEVKKKNDFDIDERTIDGASVEPLEVTRKKATLEEILSKNRRIDYRYEKLSEKVEDIISKWNQELKSAEEVLKELEEVENEADNIKQKIEQSDLTDAERSLKSVILEYDVDDKTAENIAMRIMDSYNHNEPENDKWWRYEQKRNYVEQMIIDELYPIYDIFNSTGIQKELLKKLIKIKQLE
jgi:type I restriction enzyme R subunit